MTYSQNVKDYIHQALPVLYPGIQINLNYLFVMDEQTNEPEIVNWNWPAPLDEAALEAKCDELAKPTREQVNAERERRIYLPKTVQISAERTFPVDMANGGRANIGDLVVGAMARNAQGDSTPFNFTDANNEVQVLTPDEMIAVGALAMAQVQEIHAFAKAIKDSPLIPEDFEDDIYWQ